MDEEDMQNKYNNNEEQAINQVDPGDPTRPSIVRHSKM